MKRKMEVSELIFKIVAYVFLILFALMCVYPFIYAISAAFSSADALHNNKVVLLPVDINADAFLYVFVTNGNRFWINYANTLFVAFLGTLWCMFYTILGGYALSKKRLLGRHGFNFFLVFTMWFSAGVVAMYNNYVNTATIFANIVGASAWDQIDLKWLVIIAMGMNASNVILLRNAFEGVPSEIEEAARIDGATELQVLTKVYIPMSKATIATVALFFGISRWNGYYWSYRMMTTQAYSWPVQVYIRDFISTNTTLAGKSDATEIPWDESFAAESVVYSMVICAIVPILIIYPFIQKYFAKGVNMGGVKE
jgi:putative aldouronate transport system permease protein